MGFGAVPNPESAALLMLEDSKSQRGALRVGLDSRDSDGGVSESAITGRGEKGAAVGALFRDFNTQRATH
jgi:hypothetical protein